MFLGFLSGQNDIYQSDDRTQLKQNYYICDTKKTLKKIIFGI